MKVLSRGASKLVGTVGMALAMLAMGCGGHETDEPAEAVDSVSSALTWAFFNNAGNLDKTNPGGIDIGEGLACKVFPYPNPVPPNKPPYLTNLAICFLAPDLSDQGEGQRVNWSVRDSNGLPSIPGDSIKSISVSAPKPENAAVFLLGGDNKVRVATGSTRVPWYTAGNFDTVRDYMSNVSDTGTVLCLKQLATIVLPSRFAPSRALIALSCTGALYVQGWNAQNQRVWKTAASSGMPWNGISPVATWREISHGPMGAYLLSSDSRVLLMASGTTTAAGDVIWTSPAWIPRTGLPPELLIKHVGGPFVTGNFAADVCNKISCTFDSVRVWRWDGTRYFVSTGVGPASNSETNPWGFIVDGSQYTGRTGMYGILNIDAWRMYIADR